MSMLNSGTARFGRHGLRIGAALLLWCGCAVGPSFVRPAPPAASAYVGPADSVSPAPAAGPGARPGVRSSESGQEIAADWWGLFRSSALDSIVRAAIAGNHSIAAARATLAAARADVTAARGAFLPQIDLGASAERRRNPSPVVSSAQQVQPGALVTNIYSFGPTASYSVDLFGGTRRLVEERRAQAEVQRYELAAAWLTLTGNVAGEAFTIASVREQIQATEEVIADDERTLAMVQREFETGTVARTDVLTAETQLADDRALLPPLRSQLATARHALSVLVGQGPAQWTPPDLDLDQFTLPQDIPVVPPSELVRRRPDVLAAEAQLHASSAAVGVATAQLLPSLTVTGSIGQESLDTGTLLDSSSRFWSVLGTISIPVFHGGTLLAQRRSAIDTYRASLADYEQAVLQGEQQVADLLVALDQDREQVYADRALLATARDALELQRLSYAAGKTDILQLTTAESTYQRARVGLARSRAQQLTDTAQLFVAMGGGWSQAGRGR
jgi:NodT family efflux transporter outer membrane factor (OMF) lipoprotein